LKTYVYILYSEKLSRFCVGITNNINRRLKEHNSGLSSFTKFGIPWKLIWITEKENKQLAEILELKIKNLTIERKLKFMKKYKEGIFDIHHFNKLISDKS